jgi:hypothetical protein
MTERTNVANGVTMKAQEKLLYLIGAALLALLVIGGIVGGLYWLTGLAGESGARWWAVTATLALPVAIAIAWRLATHAAREHLAGFDRGLTGAQKTVETMGRSLSATASLARTARPTALTLMANDDLLPKVGTMRLIESSRNTDELIDL